MSCQSIHSYNYIHIYSHNSLNSVNLFHFGTLFNVFKSSTDQFIPFLDHSMRRESHPPVQSPLDLPLNILNPLSQLIKLNRSHRWNSTNQTLIPPILHSSQSAITCSFKRWLSHPIQSPSHCIQDPVMEGNNSDW